MGHGIVRVIVLVILVLDLSEFDFFHIVAKEAVLIVVRGGGHVVRQGARIAPRQFEVLPALGPQPFQRRVERIVPFVDFEHDQNGVEGCDEKADRPGEPEDLILAAAVNCGRILDGQKTRNDK